MRIVNGKTENKSGLEVNENGGRSPFLLCAARCSDGMDRPLSTHPKPTWRADLVYLVTNTVTFRARLMGPEQGAMRSEWQALRKDRNAAIDP